MGNICKSGSYANALGRIPVVSDQQAANLVPASPVFIDEVFDEHQASEVIRGNTRYNQLYQEGSVSIYKQRIIGMDMATLQSLLTKIQRTWQNFSLDDFATFKDLVRGVEQGSWPFNRTNLKVKLDSNQEKTQHLYFRIQRVNEDSLSLCKPNSRGSDQSEASDSNSAEQTLKEETTAGAHDLSDSVTERNQPAATNYKYDLVLMYFSSTSDEPVDKSVVFGGMMSEGLVARDSENHLYMLF